MVFRMGCCKRCGKQVIGDHERCPFCGKVVGVDWWLASCISIALVMSLIFFVAFLAGIWAVLKHLL